MWTYETVYVAQETLLYINIGESVTFITHHHVTVL